MKDTIVWSIIVQIILIVLNAIFACAEIAVLSMNENKLRKLVESGDKKAIRLEKLTCQPARFLATIQVAITLSGFLGSAFAADNFSDNIVDFLAAIGVPLSLKTLDTISVIFITLILSYFTLVFGELVPKRVAMKKSEQLALGLSSLISFIAKLFAPLVWILTISTNILLHLLGIDPNAEEATVSEEEIRMMIDVGTQKGVIDLEEKELIHNVFEFDDLTVGEFATHRTEVVILWLEEGIEKWESIIYNSHHSFYPVCNKTVDDVIGILNVKDYFRIQKKTLETILNKAVTAAYFVPETVYADVLFRQMKQTHQHFAIVLDEYGGMVGIVTLSDLLEQLVGDLENEDCEENEILEIEPLNSQTWRIRGCAKLSEVQEQLNVTLPVEEYDTFGGFVFSMYGSIPSDGTEFELDVASLHIKVTEIKNHRIEKAIVYILQNTVD